MSVVFDQVTLTVGGAGAAAPAPAADPVRQDPTGPSPPASDVLRQNLARLERRSLRLDAR